MVGGALCAAATTLNGLIGAVPIPLVMLSRDGWLPKGLGTLHPRFKTAYKYLFIYYLITMTPLVIGVNISAVTDMTLLGSYCQTAIFIFNMRKIPDLFPEQWEKSVFHMPRGVFNVIMWVCFIGACFNVYGQLTNSDAKTIAFNVAIMAVGIIYSLVWFKNVKPTVSYELES